MDREEVIAHYDLWQANVYYHTACCPKVGSRSCAKMRRWIIKQSPTGADLRCAVCNAPILNQPKEISR